MGFENGLYVVTFAAAGSGGAGVVYFQDGKLRGGDSMMVYMGTYNENDGQLTADVHSYKHTSVPGMTSVFGVDDLHIHLTGTTKGGMISLTGSSREVKGVNISVSLVRLHN